MAATVGGYFSEIGTGDTSWSNIEGSPTREWLIVIHMVAGGSLADMGSGDPGDGNDWPRGSWQLLTQIDAGEDAPKIRVWAVKFVDQVLRSISLPATSGVENHSHLYFIGGQRPGEKAEEVFSIGANSSDGEAAASQVGRLYAPDDGGLLIGAWISAGLVNYTMPGTFSARTELDGTESTSRTGEETLTAHGPSTRTATASASELWASVSIVARDPGESVSFPASPLTGRVELALGGNPASDPARWASLWTDITDDVYMRDPIAITRGRGDEASTSQPSTMSLTLNNTAGKYVRLNPLSPYYGKLNKNTPIRFHVDPGSGMDVRYTGFVSEWPPRSQGGQVDENMPIQAAGALRRLGQGQVLRSPLYRSITSTAAFDAYWPLETDASSGIPGGRPMTLSGPRTFTEGPAGSAGAISFDSGGTATARVTGVVETPDAGTGWNVAWMLEIPEDFDEDNDFSIMVNWLTPGATGFNQWFAYVAPGFGGKLAMDGFDFGVSEFAIQGSVDLRGRGPVLVTANAFNFGSSLEFSFHVYGTDFTDFQIAGPQSGQIGPITSVGINGYQAANGNPATKGTVSHLFVANKRSSVELQSSQFVAAGTGYAGERATERIRRLSAETGVPVVIVGDDGTSEPMGPQPIGTLLDIWRDVEATDGGVLYEQRDGRLAYQPRRARFNATTALRLDYAARRVAPPLEPTDDDQRSRNDWTISRDGGGSARVVDHDSIDGDIKRNRPGIGLYDDSATLNVENDDQLLDQAGWRVHEGTAEGLRYPAVSPNLLGTPELIPGWLAADIGDAAAITRPGRDLPPGDIDLFVEGYTESIDVTEWRATMNCSPGRSAKVAVLDLDALDRPDTAGSELADDVTSGGTTATAEDFEDATFAVTITDGGDAAWARTSTHARTGAWSLKSGDITDDQTSDAEVTVPAGAEWLLFWYRVSSEPTFDFLRVLVDDVEKLSASGQVDWTRGAVNVTGATTVTFRYDKDGATSMFDDAAWIDDLLFSTTTTISVDTTSGPLWTIDETDMPVPITVGGEDMAATSIGETLNANPYVETDVTGWTSFNSTITRSTAQVHPNGIASILITPDGTSATGGATADSVAGITAGEDYIAVAWVYSPAGWSDIRVGVDWKDSSDVLVGSPVFDGQTAAPAATWTRLQKTFTAPAGAARAAVRVRHASTPAATDIWYAWGIRLIPAGSPQQMSVIRSLNGVVKAHDSGDDVRLSQPMILSL